MNEPTEWTVPAIAASAIILAGFLAALLVNWPGHLSYDSILQLLQGRTALYNTWHPPVMAWLLGLGDAILPGAGLFVIFDALLAFGALFSLLFLKPVRSGWLAAIVVLIAAPLPQLFLYQALVWKDVLFADACVAGFVCLAHAAARWLEHRTRTVLLVAGFVLLALAALTRQNGAVILPFAAAGLGWAAAQSGATRKTAALIGGAFFAGSLVFVFAAGALLNLRSDGEPGTAEQLHVLQLYDLAGAVAHDPKLVLDPLDDDDPDLAQAIRRDGARLYTPVRNDPLVSAPSMQAPLRTADFDAMRANWMALVLGHPGLYLRGRAEVFAWLVFTPDIAACRPIFTGIEGPLPALRQLGIAPRRDAHDVALERYGKSFFGTPVLSHATFALIALGCLIFLLRRRRPADIVFAALLAASFAFTASFFVISISCDYRYLYVVDLCAITALFYVARDLRGHAMSIELGLIEGYYGTPWSWATRAKTIATLKPHGYTHYIYAPKMDAFLRKRWRESHPSETAEALRALSARCRALGVRFGVGLSPFELYRDFNSAAQADLKRKLEEFDAWGIDDLAILFDDMRGDLPNLAGTQADILHWVKARTKATRLIMCPSYYTDDPVLDRFFGQRPKNYLEDLGRLMDRSIEVFWTGEEVCSKEYSPGHLQRVGEQLRRKPFLWDNYPVNDGQRMSQYLHVRAFTGRPASLAPHLAAHSVNPALQPMLTCIPAITLALSYAQGDAYEYGRAFAQAARAIMGAELAQMIQGDILFLQDVGLPRLAEKTAARLRQRYCAIDHDAAREIVAWLDGAYRFAEEIA